MNDLQRAVTEAFVYVSASDGDFAAPELERFVQWAADQEAFAQLEAAELAACFGDVAEGFAQDFAAAEARALAAAERVRDAPEAADLVLSAAGVAVVADGTLAEVEETAVDRLSRALGRPAANR